MKNVLALTIALLVLSLGPSLVNAQVPHIQVFFDDGTVSDYGYDTRVCTPGTFEDAYVVARNFNIWLVAIEYAVSYPPGIMWVGDSEQGDLFIGQTPASSTPGGISSVWRMPQNAFNSLRIATISYFCDQCNPDSPIVVVPNPVSGYIRATRYPDLDFVYGIGLTSIFCPVTIPAENTTWGNVKALYGE